MQCSVTSNCEMDNLMDICVHEKKKDLGLNLNIVFMEFPGS